MKILVDAHSLEIERTGKPFFTLNLLHGLSEISEGKNHKFYLTCRRKFDLGFSLPENFEFLELGNGDSKSFHFNLIKKVRSDEFDIFWSATSFIPSSLSKIPTVTFIYDFASFQEGNFKKNKKAEFFEKLLIKRVVKNSKALVAISEATKNQLLERFPESTEKTFVVPGAPREFPESEKSDSEILKTFGVKKDNYLFFVGTLEPRKNLVNLIKAFSKAFKNEINSPILAIAGKKGWYFEEIFNTVREEGIQSKVNFLGYTEDSEMPALFRNCKFFVYTPFYEGFGLPVIEAISFGKAVITSNTSSLPEAVGPCGITVDPQNIEEIAENLKNLWISDPKRKEFEARTKEWVNHYTKEENARKLMGIFEGLNG